MSRSRATAKKAGSTAERAVADYFALRLNDDRIDRRPKRGQLDRGDIGGIKLHGQRLVIEVKNCARQSLPEWISQAHTEAINDGSLAGLVVSKRIGTTDPGKWWVHMTVDDLLALMTGERHGHRTADPT